MSLAASLVLVAIVGAVVIFDIISITKHIDQQLKNKSFDKKHIE
jgi:hypothetical protein